MEDYSMKKYLSLIVVILIIGTVFSNRCFSLTIPDQDRYAGLTEYISDLKVTHAGMFVTPVGDYKSFQRDETWNNPAWQDFLVKYGTEWDISVDHRNERPDIIQGQGIPWFPGDGNNLGSDFYAQFNLDGTQDIDLDFLEMRARMFMDDNADLFHLDQDQLVLDRDGSFISRRYSIIRFKQVVDTIPVRQSNVYFRINNGNLIQFGTYKYEDVTIPTVPVISDSEALSIAIDHLVGKLGGDVELSDPVELLIVPVAAEGDEYVIGEPFQGARGHGYSHKLTYRIHFRYDVVPGDWVALVDARDGTLLVMDNNRRYAVVDGGVFPETNLDPETTLPMPFARVSNNGQKETNSGGAYSYSGGNASCSLNGNYVNIHDNCGSINLSSGAPGDLHFGGSSGTDCTTPGVGGSGNTHSARSCFYHINRMKQLIRKYQPSNSWLSGNLTANVNVNDTCNAYWDNGEVNFFRSGGGCSNTGELSAVFIHETGHGFDTNDGNGFSPDAGTGEAYADTCAFTITHSSCIGNNFTPGNPCSMGCDSLCTGVRDVNTAVNAGTSNIESAPANCDRWDCPYYNWIWPYMGPMGYEGHCESLIATQAWWDAIASVRSVVGDGAGWEWAARLWYTGAPGLAAAYQVVSGGQCNPSAIVNGCNGGSYYNVLLGVDDDNGNLADGTPNGCRLWTQFSLHGIACGAMPACYSTCPSVGMPTLHVASGGGTVSLSWNAVAGAAQYQVFRNNIGCTHSLIPITTTSALNFVDTDVALGVTYYYALQAIGTDSDCRGPMTDCEVVTVGSGPTPTPGPPTNTPSPTLPPGTATPPPTPTQTYTPINTNTPIPTNTRIPTFTPPPHPTNTPLPTFTHPPQPTFTPTRIPATDTPAPANTPTPMPTATPACDFNGVTLWMPSHMFSPGNPCSCTVTVCNADTVPLKNYPLAVVLDVYGSYYFAPDFSSEFTTYLDRYPQFQPGETVIEVLPEFSWPENVAPADGIFWYAALLTPDMTAVYGNMSTWQFGWTR